MIIIWSGYGKAMPFLIFLGGLAGWFLGKLVFGDPYVQSHMWPMWAGAGLASALMIPLGISLDKDGESHSLYFIPMHWWGVVATTLCVMMILGEFGLLDRFSKSSKTPAATVAAAAPVPAPVAHYYLKAPVKVTNPNGNLQLPARSEVQFVQKDGAYSVVKSGQYKFKVPSEQLETVTQ